MKIWDLPTRIYHWLQAVLFIALLGSGFSGNGPHIQIGLVLFTLLMWRICWGLIGSTTSRFQQFLASPSTVVRYVKTGKSNQIGHNPAGGWMAFLMIFALLFQCLSGMAIAGQFDGLAFAENVLTDDVFFVIESMHMICARLLPALIALHVGAIVFYKYKGISLTWAMVTGIQKHINTNVTVYFASNIRALVVLAIAISVTIAIVAFA